MNDFEGLYDIRDAKESDRNFILATFLRGLYYGDSWFSLIPKQTFMTKYKPVAETMLKGCVIKIACLKDEPDVILGYSIISQDYLAINWVFVKNAWRRKGIARSLVPKYPASVSHLTALGKTLLDKLNGAVFDPFKI